MKFSNPIYILLLVAMAMATFTNCVDSDFDEPPVGGTVSDLVGNTTVADLKAAHISGELEEILDDLILEVTVVSSDEAGNFYKELIVQDATGGIAVSTDLTNLYTEYPVGRTIFIKCQGLYLGDDNGGLELGGGIGADNNGNPRLDRIAEGLLGNFIEKGAFGTATPRVKNINDLNNDDIYTLVQLEGVEFVSADANETYANLVDQFSQNRTLEDCNGNSIIVRSSNFANFGGALTPNGNGTITAVHSVFSSDKQLFIRDLNDVDMEADRCDGTGGGGTGGGTGGGGSTGELVWGEYFDGGTQYDVVSLADWMNIAEVGSDDERWFWNEFDDAKYVESSAFNSADATNVNWLITPAIELSADRNFSFTSAQHHWESSTLTVWVADDFDGTNVATANWQEISCTLANETNDWYEMIPSGAILLNDYFSSGTVHVGFRYEGSADSNTTGIQIDNVEVRE